MKKFISKYKIVIFCSVLMGIPVGGIIGYTIVVPDSNLQDVIVAIFVTSILTNIAWWFWCSKKK